MIPSEFAADRSNTYGTVGCKGPSTAGPGVIARVSGVGVVRSRSAIGKCPTVGIPSDSAYSAAAPVADDPPAAARRKSAIPVLERSSARSRVSESPVIVVTSGSGAATIAARSSTSSSPW